MLKIGDLVKIFSDEHEKCHIEQITFTLSMYDEWMSIDSVIYETLSYRRDMLVVLDTSIIEKGGNGVRVLTTTGKTGWVHRYTLKRV